ncbi:MAG: hypothetical protein M3Y91_08210 [Actinomycetota bacterium]|nr:hypothetical protein [Actinomycetota bacterium]
MHEPDAVVDALEAATTSEDPPVWFEVRGDDHNATMTLARHDDLAQLFGWVSSPACAAIGVVAGGWGRPQVSDLDLDRLSPGWVPQRPALASGGDSPELTGVRVIVVVDRRGLVGARTTLADGRTVAGGCRGGRLFDALHRGLGLPTDPPPVSSAAIIGDLWLAAVVGDGRQRGHRLGWSEATALHPAAQALADHGHTLSRAEVDAVIRVAPRAWTWDRLQADTVSGGGLSDLVAPDIASWMDTGMFARWTLELMGDARSLWGRAASVLDRDAVVRLADALDAAEAGADGFMLTG